ncbi:flagellar biosynthetic protein FliQ [Acinetobacter baumannii]|nr:flagellar biosynthetic protein FliQ [Acinetobacter baumannii]MDC5226816.1 flagellar biosynthetic protein FliQ [Acinetobacter baumannii]
MNQDQLLYLLKETLLTTAMVAAPLLLAIMIVGLLVSILQVATQIQEMTLTFIPKLIVSVVMLLVLGGWMINHLRAFAVEMFLKAANL